MMDISLQDQLYIVSASLAVVTIIFLVFCIVLCVSVRRLKSDNKERKRKEFENEIVKKSENQYAYNNPSIQPDEELHHRGYQMHQGQIVPRLRSSNDGGYTSELPPVPRKPTKSSSGFSNSSRDFIPINDIKATKDASRDFKTIMNPNSSVFDDDTSYTDSRLPSSKVNHGNTNGYIPPRTSQFNNNIVLRPSVGQNPNGDSRQDGVTYFNNRAIDY